MLSLILAPVLAPVLAASLTALALPSGATHDVGDEQGTIGNSWSVHAERVYTSTGEVLKNALVEISDGKLTSVRPGRSAPQDALRVKALTAGMIDLSARVNTGRSSVEQTSEVQPTLEVANSIDLYDLAWARLARSGVTTVLVNPLDQNVIGGRGVLLKTAGPESVAARTVKSRGVVRGAIGRQPSDGNHAAFGRPTDFFSRRPTTRMGVEWEWRKAFFDAVAAPRLPEVDFPGSEELRAVLAGERVLIIQAWATQDIRTAVYLKEEMQAEGFGDIDLVIDAGAEAWREPLLLERTDTPVILPPYPTTGRTTDGAFMARNTARLLIDNGITVCLSSHGGSTFATRLDRQAGHAMAGGLSFEEALAAVTINPARILGVEDRMGSVEVGKDADLVFWNGKPFEPTTRVIGVLIDGELVLDPR
ncbi:MAG: amidohydrolase family protein [Planctomycetota bacterium]